MSSFLISQSPEIFRDDSSLAQVSFLPPPGWLTHSMHN